MSAPVKTAVAASDGPVRSWVHTRKGLIKGVVVNRTDDNEWLDIQLVNHVRGYVNRWEPGEVIRCRRSFLTEVAS